MHKNFGWANPIGRSEKQWEEVGGLRTESPEDRQREIAAYARLPSRAGRLGAYGSA